MRAFLEVGEAFEEPEHDSADDVFRVFIRLAARRAVGAAAQDAPDDLPDERARVLADKKL